jgi:predicted SAM-dependent methyltransferase
MPPSRLNQVLRGSKLQLGCGGKDLVGYTNTDGRLSQSPAGFAVDIMADDLPLGHFSEIYMSHVLEHVYPDLAPALLVKLRQALIPGGILRLAVPDLRKVLLGCVLTSPEDPEYFGPEPDYPLFGPCLSTTPDWDRHKWCFTREKLAKVLLQADFIDIQTWDAVSIPAIWQGQDYACQENISLNLMAHKPAA